MPINYAIDYQLVSNAAAALEKASDDYKKISLQLEALRVDLHDRDFVGETGVALSNHIGLLNGKLDQLNQRCSVLQAALLDTLNEIQNDIEPSMAAPFRT